jgi:hypothetical protein
VKGHVYRMMQSTVYMTASRCWSGRGNRRILFAIAQSRRKLVPIRTGTAHLSSAAKARPVPQFAQKDGLGLQTYVGRVYIWDFFDWAGLKP